MVKYNQLTAHSSQLTAHSSQLTAHSSQLTNAYSHNYLLTNLLPNLNFSITSFILAIALLLTVSSEAYSATADVGGSLGPQAPLQAPEVSQTADAPVTTFEGFNDSSTQAQNFEGEIDSSQAQTLQQQDTNEINTEANASTQDTPLTDNEINNYFNEILESGTTTGNTIGRLFRGLPRYGMSFFRRSPSTYAPMESVPVAQDYRINVGDTMTLSIWGIPEEGNFNFTVGRDGMARLRRIGAVRLAGYTFAEAERILRAKLNQYYTGYQMYLSMGRLSSIMVYVTGNARRPGAYTISSFSTLVNALLVSGGPSANGTLRRIELRRDGRTIAVFDMYAMLMKGDKSQDVRLQAGDVIYIPPVGDLIGIAGEIQQPGVYELNGATRVQDLLYIAGGLNARTFTGRIQYYKIIDHTYASAIEGTIAEFEDTILQDGDILRLYPVFNYTTSIVISGALFNPGTYAIIPNVTKISDIIKRAGGLVITSSNKAIITRVTPTLSGPAHERYTIDLAKALQGDPANDLKLQANDRINVMSIPEWKAQLTVTIAGEVKIPGTYYMFPGEKLSDLIQRAEGFTDKAYVRGAIFTRRSVAAQQRASLSSMADQMELDLLQAVQDSTSAGTNALYQRHRQLINKLRTLDIMGRVVTKIDTPKNIIGTEWDYELQNGDRLYIPEFPLTVNVMGAVYTAQTLTYRSNMSINSCINASGGAIKAAHKRMLYLIKSDGTVLKLTRSTAALTSKEWKAPPGFSANIEPGDTIVVPLKNLDRHTIESLRDTIDIIYKVAISAGVVIRDFD